MNPHKKPNDYMSQSAARSFGARDTMEVDAMIENEIRDLEKAAQADVRQQYGLDESVDLPLRRGASNNPRSGITLRDSLRSSFGGIGSLTLYIRSLTIEILKSDYIFFARSRGLDNRKILRYYILTNLYPPVITLLGLSLPGIIGGSVILEKIFSINGMGLLFFNSALSHDYPVIMGILIIGAMLTLIGNLLADLILLKINPNFNAK